MLLLHVAEVPRSLACMPQPPGRPPHYARPCHCPMPNPHAHAVRNVPCHRLRCLAALSLQGGSVNQLLCKQLIAPHVKQYNDLAAYRWLRQVAAAVAFLHSHEPKVRACERDEAATRAPIVTALAPPSRTHTQPPLK